MLFEVDRQSCPDNWTNFLENLIETESSLSADE